MQIRQEVFDDRAGIYAVTHAAFSKDDHLVEPIEVGLVQRLFDCNAYSPTFSLVATNDKTVIAHVIATWGTVDGKHSLLGLGPLAVAPEYQNMGAGTALMQAISDRAENERISGIVLLGATKYYQRFGYEPAIARGIIPTQRSWGDNFMVRVFDERSLPAGQYRYASPFGC
ncbi:GNAT family N-acetyltransferase [Arthrobacter sp. MYb211]|uniref:GNAT family N-acetyltransferase n=1 Tax=unclassified Arthrobacter TaxID=235627 RepID=UPI000CFB9E58|nr:MULTISPECIES: N-acetyltransferase [unclassified Arthrobacter]PQZ96965.1 GNAT family N-acetyltransferase [Arthrobacter sp. MYb224]PQZ99154.1 GNAT family N-acetyltransferase [Arthrobacter sp. MYb229]PRA10482.1 GNAT family N-acetyltransferase [Arthrobacter sp. MYb221]PRB47539.1 GNAT family N-acetyltransferase [Arthrobacter sp. MYb216]PRC06052.1 GNAT family N-acetyltransferase [Arthrobacter sp. MYb211]